MFLRIEFDLLLYVDTFATGLLSTISAVLVFDDTNIAAILCVQSMLMPHYTQNLIVMFSTSPRPRIPVFLA